MSLIVCGGAILGWRPGEVGRWPAPSVAGACLCWATGQHLTRKISRGLVKHRPASKVCGRNVNLCVAAAFGAACRTQTAAAAALIGLPAMG